MAKKKRKLSLLSCLLLGVGIALIAAAAFMWGRAQYDYYQQDKVNDELSKFATIPDGDGAPTVDWEALKAINEDVVGWIEIPGTSVSYPVYQGDSNEEYLHTNAHGEYSVGGQVFIDFENTAPGMIDHQTMVYGHHLKDGTMFQPVSEMDSQDVFDSHPTIWYVTEEQNFELMPLFLYYTTENDYDARKITFESDGAFRQYLAERLKDAVTSNADAEGLIAFCDHALTLSTCNYYDGYGRTILVCVPKSEVAGYYAGTTS